MPEPIIQPIYDSQGNIVGYEEYRDPGLLPDGTYAPPSDPATGQPLGLPPSADPSDPWNEQTGNWNNPTPTPSDTITNPTPTPTPTPSPTPSPSPTPAPQPRMTATNPGFTDWAQTFAAPTPQALPDLPGVPDAPAFEGPTYEKPDAFRAPSVDDVLQDPSYQFRKSQGEDSLQRWAAARGTLNDSGTAKSLLDYGQGAASQEYANVWNRDFNAYNTNVQTQHVQPYQFAFDSAVQAFQPKLQTWQQGLDMSKLGYATNTATTREQNNNDYSRAWDRYIQDYNVWRDKRDYGTGLAAM